MCTITRISVARNHCDRCCRNLKILGHEGGQVPKSVVHYDQDEQADQGRPEMTRLTIECQRGSVVTAEQENGTSFMTAKSTVVAECRMGRWSVGLMHVTKLGCTW